MFNGLFQRSDGLFCVRFRPSTGRLNGTDTPYKGGRTVVPFSQRSVLKTVCFENEENRIS